MSPAAEGANLCAARDPATPGAGGALPGARMRGSSLTLELLRRQAGRRLALAAALLLAACNNNPWPHEAAASNTHYTAVIESSPRHLDPTASYWNNDTPYTYQIYEPPYGYHYLKRPFQLVPKSAAAVVKPRYVD